MYVHYNTLLYTFIHPCLSLSLMPSDLSTPEGDPVRKSARQEETVQAIGTTRCD